MTVGLFWTAIGVLAYTYIGFPLLVLARGVLRPRAIFRADTDPFVSIVIAARNEASAIAAKLDNLLALDYDAGRREIIVASDGSDDGTDAIVRSYADRGVRLVSLPRVGKAAALNAGVVQAGGEILVFSDANSMFREDALRALLRPLADRAVGGVAGDQRYLPGTSAEGVSAGERRYWDFDRLLKVYESKAGSTISATGAIYAVRRHLFEPIVEGVTDDFYTSTGVIAAGARLVFEPEAVAFEPVAPSGGVEFGRKVRIITRGLRGVLSRRALLDPRRHGFYSIQLLSHKVLRRLMALPLIALAVTGPALWRRGAPYRLFALGQGAFYGLAAVGAVLPLPQGRTSRLLRVPSYFCLVNAAALRAVVNLLLGQRIDRWEPQRGP